MYVFFSLYPSLSLFLSCSLPKQRIFSRELHENLDIVHYDNAYRHAHNVDCAKQYGCQFSLLELAFGKYSSPPKNYYAQ